MGAGDGNRVWVPKMIETLRSQWERSDAIPGSNRVVQRSRRNVSETAAQQPVAEVGTVRRIYCRRGL